MFSASNVLPLPVSVAGAVLVIGAEEQNHSLCAVLGTILLMVLVWIIRHDKQHHGGNGSGKGGYAA
jgi:hypothetical protein